MANLTVTVEDEVLRAARIRALDQGTSVNALVSEMLTRYARIRREQDEATDALLALAATVSKDDHAAAEARGGRHWSREQLHER